MRFKFSINNHKYYIPKKGDIFIISNSDKLLSKKTLYKSTGELLLQFTLTNTDFCNIELSNIICCAYTLNSNKYMTSPISLINNKLLPIDKIKLGRFFLTNTTISPLDMHFALLHILKDTGTKEQKLGYFSSDKLFDNLNINLNTYNMDFEVRLILDTDYRIILLPNISKTDNSFNIDDFQDFLLSRIDLKFVEDRDNILNFNKNLYLSSNI